MKLGEAFVALGFDVDDDKLKAFEGKINELETSMFKVTGTTAAALYGIDKFIDSVSRGAIALRDMSIQTGLSQNALQNWSIAAHMSDTAFSIDAALSSLQALQGHLAQLQQGGGNARPFSMLLNADARAMSATEVLQRLHQQLPYDLQRFGAAGVSNLMQEAGIDPHFLNLLEQTDDQFRKTMQGAQQFMMTVQQNKNLDAMGFALDQLDLKFDKLKKTIGAQFAPALIEAMEALPGILLNIGTALDKIKEPLAWIVGVGAVALSPWLQLASVIGGVLYILYEIGGVLNGQDDALARLLDKFKHIGDYIQNHILNPMERLLGSKFFPNLPENAGKDSGPTIGETLKVEIPNLVNWLVQAAFPSDMTQSLSQFNGGDTTINIHGPVRESLDAAQTYANRQNAYLHSRLNTAGGQ